MKKYLFLNSLLATMLLFHTGKALADDGTLYYYLLFYGSGAYRICLYDEDGNSYLAWLSI